MSDKFYQTQRWRELRYRILRKHGFKCMACGSRERIHVDHIKPRSKYPGLEYCENNLQVLCEDCNLGKSNKFEDSFVVDDLSEQEKKAKLQLERFDEYAREKAFPPDKAARLKKILERDAKVFYLKRKARELTRAVGHYRDPSLALEQIMNIHLHRRKCDEASQTFGEDNT